MNYYKLLFAIPFIIFGLVLIFMGSLWIFSSEPWMLDKFANEQRLNMKFEKLFEAEINLSLPGYLKQIYRFFGLWVFSLGIFILGFTKLIFNGNNNLNLTLLVCNGILIYFGMIMAYYLIPSSPFIYLGWLSIMLHTISLFIYINYIK
tara:strand:+ start:154 stop:597 length:444 start_codon:yes stop_codon:yes gene_type:complete